MTALRCRGYVKRDIALRPVRKQIASARGEKEKFGSNLVPDAHSAAAFCEERKRHACRHMNFLPALLTEKASPISARISEIARSMAPRDVVRRGVNAVPREIGLRRVIHDRARRKAVGHGG